MRLREVAAMVAAPPRLSRRREEQTGKATKCLSDHSAYNAAINGAKAKSNTKILRRRHEQTKGHQVPE